MTDEALQKAADRIREIPQTLPHPSQLVLQLQRDLNMTQIAELVNEGKRNSVYHWREGTREPGWENFVKLLYACGYKIEKKKR